MKHQLTVTALALALSFLTGCAGGGQPQRQPSISASEAAEWAACTLRLPASVQDMATVSTPHDSRYPELDAALSEVYNTAPVICPAIENNRFFNKEPRAADTITELEKLQNRMCGYMRNVGRDKETGYRETARELRLIADLIEADSRAAVNISNELQRIHEEKYAGGKLCWRWP